MDNDKSNRGPAVFDFSEQAVNPPPREDGGIYPQTGDALLDLPYCVYAPRVINNDDRISSDVR